MSNLSPEEIKKAREITAEKSLFAILRVSVSVLRRSKINFYSTFFVSTLFFCIATDLSIPTYDILKSLRNMSEIGLNFSGAILGFLIAGFTIFASVSDKKIFVVMAEIVEPKTKLTYLKYNFFPLIYVFTSYLGFTVFCFFIQSFIGESSPIPSVINNFIKDHEFVKSFLIRVCYFLFFSWFFYDLIILQSFIFNVYHMVMTLIRWEVEKLDEDH